MRLIKLAPPKGFEPLLTIKSHINSVLHYQLCYRGVEIGVYDPDSQSRTLSSYVTYTFEIWRCWRDLNPAFLP